MDFIFSDLVVRRTLLDSLAKSHIHKFILLVSFNNTHILNEVTTCITSRRIRNNDKQYLCKCGLDVNVTSSKFGSLFLPCVDDLHSHGVATFSDAFK